MKCSKNDCHIDLGIGCSLGEPSPNDCKFKKAGRNKVYFHKTSRTYYISDGLYLYCWNKELKDWDDSDYTIRDSFFEELEEL